MDNVKLNDFWKGTIVLFLLSWLYFSSWGQAVINYQNDHYLFLYTGDYLEQFLNMPGGISQWLSAFFTQFYFYPLLGAFVNSFLLIIVWLLLRQLFQKWNAKLIHSFALIPLFILLTLLLNYENTLLIVVAVILNLLFLLVHISLKKWMVRLFAGIISILILYVATGAFYWLFILPAIVCELFLAKDYKRVINSLVLLFISLYLPYFLALHHYFIFIQPAYIYPLQTKAYSIVFPIGGILLVLLLAILVGKIAKHIQFPKQKKFHISRVLNSIIFGIGVAFVVNSYNPKTSDILRISQAGKSQQWNKVLEISSQCRTNNLLVPYYTNLALAQQGQLLDKLFQYHQKAGVNGLFFTWEKNRHLREYGGLFYYTIGYVNEAHHWAYESMVNTGPVAPVLKELVTYNLVQGKLCSAQKYLNVLKQSLFYRSWAFNVEKQCCDTLCLNNQTWVKNKRNQIPPGDFHMDLKGYEKDLLHMVDKNSHNKIALDYLIAFYLLSNQQEKIIDNIELINQYYKDLPVVVKQVLASYDLNVLIAEEQVADYSRYKDMKISGNRHQLKQEFGYSFWYYVDFICPHKKKVKNVRYQKM
jgi:hypothetical protein